MNNMKIIFENGIKLDAKYFGFKKEVYGTFIFNTSIVGYEESLTDPSYKDEILVMTFPLQGIYGINQKDQESSKIHLAAFIVNSYEKHYSNNHAVKSLDAFLKENEVLGIYDVDTRYLTKLIRKTGSLKAAIVFDDFDQKDVDKKLAILNIKDQVKNVSPKQIEILNSESKKCIVFYDFGAKNSIKKEFIKRGYKIVVVPYNTSVGKALSYKPEFIFLSNGPGDPADLLESIDIIKLFIKQNIKIVGICLGNQLLSLALGGKTTRLKFGHHSTNHPIKNLLNNKVYITSQNHNYSIVENSLSKDVNVFLRSLNDNSIEGILSEKYNIIATQFHPEAAPGTSDANALFDMFIDFNKGDKLNA